MKIASRNLRQKDHRPAFRYDTHSVVSKGPSNLSNPEFPGHTLLVFRPFIFYDASKIALAGT